MQPARIRRKNPMNVTIPESKEKDQTEELYLLRDNRVVRRLRAGVPFENTYEVVWPSDCAGK